MSKADWTGCVCADCGKPVPCGVPGHFGISQPRSREKQMPETKELSADEAVAMEFLMGFEWDNHATWQIDKIHADLAETIREAREQGAKEMREKCADLLEEYSELEMPPQYSHKQHCLDFTEGWKRNGRRMALEIRALPTSSEEPAPSQSEK